MTSWHITDLIAENEQAVAQTANLLFEGFKTHWANAWPSLTDALAEVKLSLGEDRISRIAIDENHQVLGWIGGISHYDGNVWELHPLVVRSDFQKQGIGTALVTNLEAEVKRRGGITLWVGTDNISNHRGRQGLIPAGANTAHSIFYRHATNAYISRTIIGEF